MKTETVRVTEEVSDLMHDMTPLERSHIFEVGLCVLREGEKWAPEHLGRVVTYLVNHAKR